eukprot:scaffold101435_cov54-Cyclotella_meneghiniana.AAC.1
MVNTRQPRLLETLVTKDGSVASSKLNAPLPHVMLQGLTHSGLLNTTLPLDSRLKGWAQYP